MSGGRMFVPWMRHFLVATASVSAVTAVALALAVFQAWIMSRVGGVLGFGISLIALTAAVIATGETIIGMIRERR